MPARMEKVTLREMKVGESCPPGFEDFPVRRSTRIQAKYKTCIKREYFSSPMNLNNDMRNGNNNGNASTRNPNNIPMNAKTAEALLLFEALSLKKPNAPALPNGEIVLEGDANRLDKKLLELSELMSGLGLGGPRISTRKQRNRKNRKTKKVRRSRKN